MAVRFLWIVTALIQIHSSAALDNGVGQLPAMGWTSVSFVPILHAMSKSLLD
jgi:hypothetical protein